PNGTKYVDSTKKEPHQKIILYVNSYLKDSTGKFLDTLVVYDYTTDEIGEIDGKRTMFQREHALTYELNSYQIYIVSANSTYQNNPLTFSGFDTRYDFTSSDGDYYIQSGVDSMFGREPVLYEDIKLKILELAELDMSLQDIEKRDRLLEKP
ncbi:hypothetical protein SKA08_15490, partial [Enterococcus faecium]